VRGGALLAIADPSGCAPRKLVACPGPGLGRFVATNGSGYVRGLAVDGIASLPRFRAHKASVVVVATASECFGVFVTASADGEIHVWSFDKTTSSSGRSRSTAGESTTGQRGPAGMPEDRPTSRRKRILAIPGEKDIFPGLTEEILEPELLSERHCATKRLKKMHSTIATYISKPGSTHGS
jgi:hypothetical protein